MQLQKQVAAELLENSADTARLLEVPRGKGEESWGGR